MNAIQGQEHLYDARAAISCFHDALLAVARGVITPEEVKDFFWKNDLDKATYYDTVVTFGAKPEVNPHD